MTIVLTGGGSGGHITPILAVAKELKAARPEVKLIYIGKRGDPMADIPAQSPLIDEVYTISAGKFRRYHGEGIRQIFDIPTVVKNVRDLFLLLNGMRESMKILKRLRPSVVFTPGGFVGVPVGFAASRLDIPFVTHDLDALPGLANRINSRHAAVHAVGMPKELYPYPADKTEYVGVPTSEDFKPVTHDMMLDYRKQLGLQEYQQVVFVIGGGLGAVRLNEAVISISKELLARYPKLALVHAAGRQNADEATKAYSKVLDSESFKRVIVKSYIDDVYRHSGAADVVITRAGATNMAEFAAQHKACIVVPNPLLSGGHQTKNAQPLADAGAVRLVTEAELERDGSILLKNLEALLDNEPQILLLGDRLGKYAKPNASKDLAKILLNLSGSKE